MSSEPTKNSHESGRVFNTRLKRKAAAALQTAAADINSAVLTRSTYEVWREAQSKHHPSATQIVREIGNGRWGRACQTAGVPATKRSDARRYSIQEIKTAINRAVEAVGEPFTIEKYNTWRESQGVDMPNHSTIATRIGDGSWEAVCQLMGVRSGTAGRNDGEVVYESEDLERVLELASEDLGRRPTRSDYQSWCEKQDEDYPCAATLRDRLGDGSWIEACRVAGVKTQEVKGD
jgi:hypothetical protein